MDSSRNLPKDWEWKKIEEIADKKSKYPVGDGDHGQIKPSMYQKEGIPYIRVQNLSEGKEINYKNLVFISNEVHSKNLKSELHPGDILIGKTGSIGKTAIVPLDMPLANTTSSVGKITVDKSKILPEYLLFYFNTIEFRDEMWKVSIKTSQPGFNIINLKKFEIPIPPLKIQKQIIEILERAEKLKHRRKQINDKTMNVIQAIFFEMFGNPFKNERKWNVEDFEEVCENLFAGGDVPRDSFSKEKNNLFNVPIYSNGTGEKALYGYTAIEKVKKDSVTISARGTIGFPVIRNAPFYPIIRLIVATPNTDKVNIYYLKESISFFNFNNAGTSIPQLTVPMIKKNKILVPPLNLQKEFEKKVEIVERIKKHQEKSYQEINNLFNALIQKAFNGELTK